ncbi:MAG: glycosyltransferase [Zoogloeaceae bacterium]|jgi:exo-beta-1,3-glucanase (GH17 family)/cellulose synthase/poly-beta-1,6-N-acetylglucosamine synthase-like glycosyltransferase|nr:glycosyltransferase [Zoogloeaceae bacterium]
MLRLYQFFYTLLSAFLIAVFVAAAQYAAWELVNRNADIADADQDIKGFAYSGYQRDQNPLQGGPYPGVDELTGDIDLLARYTRRIRTYSSLENADIVPLAGFRNMKVTIGIWLDKDTEKNAREIAAGIELARKYKHVERIIVGNETLLRKDMTLETLIPLLKEVKKATKKPVSTAEPYHVWLDNPELVKHVNFITLHLFPFHEKKELKEALAYAMERYDEVHAAYPRKKLVIGEIGWPSNGANEGAAIPSRVNEAEFIRSFLTAERTRTLDYFILEAFDQPWKVDLGDGAVQAFWGAFDVDRAAKFPLEGAMPPDIHWQEKAWNASFYAFFPMFLITFFLGGWSFMGRLWLALLVQASVTTLTLGIHIPFDTQYYPSQRDLIALVLLITATLVTIAVLLAHGYEFGEVLFKRVWKRRFTPLPALPPEEEPFVSIHLACYNEPPEMVIETIDSLARMHYRNFEVLVIDNNTADEALWKPVEAHMADMGPNFRFFHLEPWPGFKAGALNFALKETHPQARIIGVVDADYVVDPNWLSCLVPHFVEAPDVAVVQAPQAHRNWEGHVFQRMCNWEFDGFFRIGMHHRNERNALIQHGTMTLVRKASLDELGGWSEWCICEDSELGLRLLRQGHDTRYVDCVLGRGLTPANFAAIKTQRFRWAFGAMQILKAHLFGLLGIGKLSLAQRYHFLTGWFSWFGDALQLVFAFASLVWTILMLVAPQSFGLPVALLVVPMLGFMAFKAALGPILYRHSMDCPWRDILGASLLSAGISHAIARGIFAGIIKRKGKFVVTPKGWKKKGGWAFFSPIREETGLLLALLLSAWMMKTHIGLEEPAARAWIAVLLLETLPYFAALACQIAAYWPEKTPHHAIIPPAKAAEV